MANKNVFKNASPSSSSVVGVKVPPTDTTNRGGGIAYSVTAEHALAQLACTGTFNDSFYGTGTDQLAGIRKAADQCSPDFIAKTALYAREKGYMKDMPAALAVMLSKADPALLDKIFDRVIDNGKQVRNYVQFIRSGAFGRKSLGSGGMRLIKRWFASRSDYSLFRASIGNAPSLGDIIKLSRPNPADVTKYALARGLTAEQAAAAVIERRAFYAYLIGRDHEVGALPQIVRDYEAWKKGERKGDVPNVDFRMLTSLPLTKEDWAEIAKRGGWHQTRMNLNTYARQGVFEITGMETVIAGKLRDPEEIRKARVFPYQLLAAYLNTGSGPAPVSYGYSAPQAAKPEVEVPQRVRLAIQDAMEIATENVPVYEGRVVVVVDTSGSMQSPITGHRAGATTKVACVDLAALVASTVLRKNPLTVVVPVDTRVHSTDMLNARDSIVTNADKLRKLGGGGTDLGAALRFIETSKIPPDLIIMVSDNESWFDGARGFVRCSGGGTGSADSWARIRVKNPNAKMVCIDVSPNSTTQVKDGNGVLNIGGFSDQIWTTIKRFVSGEGPETWVQEIKALSLDTQPAGGGEDKADDTPEGTVEG
jgi:60 kDa SS-A/Ro ribonucleoprotein